VSGTSDTGGKGSFPIKADAMRRGAELVMEPWHERSYRYAAVAVGRGLFYALLGPPIGGIVLLLFGWLRDFEGGLSSLAAIPVLGFVTWPFAIFLMGLPAFVTGALTGLFPARSVFPRVPANLFVGAVSVAAYLALLPGEGPPLATVGGLTLAGGVAAAACGELLQRLRTLQELGGARGEG
jgi:hypothetical protein